MQQPQASQGQPAMSSSTYASYQAPGQYPQQQQQPQQSQPQANPGYQQGFVGQPQQAGPMGMSPRFPMPGPAGAAIQNNPYGMGQRFSRYPQAPGYR